MRAEGYMMPRVVEGKTEDLVAEILDYAKSHDALVLNCKNLERVEFGASAQLLNGLVPISGQGKPIEFTEVNYLVMHLFNAMGLKNVAAIKARARLIAFFLINIITNSIKGGLCPLVFTCFRPIFPLHSVAGDLADHAT